ncbi:MAG: hypothetical protein ACFFBD_27390 [Candidatus Hodarchaeota archaeon]
MEKKQNFLIEDTAIYQTGLQWMATALDIAYDWVAQPNISKLNRIISYLNFRLWLLRRSNIGKIEWYFFNNTSAEEYALATKGIDGFDLKISRDEWQARGFGNHILLSDSLTQFNFPAAIIPPIVNHPDAPPFQIGMQINRFNEYLQEFVIEQQAALNYLKFSINQISNGFAFITLATILSLFAQRFLPEVPENVKKEMGIPVLIILIVAVILAGVGLLLIFL